MPSIFTLQSPKITGSLHLQGTSKLAYTGTGTPWTALETSPFVVAMNDATGPRWTAQNPAPGLILGDVSSVALGAQLISRVYPPKEETIPIQAYATTPANRIFLKRLLENAVMDGATLYIEPDGMAGAYYSVVTGRVQELPASINEEAGGTMLRLLLILTLQPLAFRQALTARASASASNAGTPFALASIGGDEALRPYLDLELYGGDLATTGIKVVHLASGVTVGTNNDNPAVSTMNMSGVAIGSAASTLTINSGVTPYNRTIRACCRLSSPSANLEVQLIVRLGSATGMVVYTSPWVAPGAVANAYVDCGAFRLSDDLFRAAMRQGVALFVERRARSTNGASATATWTSVILVAHHTWARLTTLQALGTNQRLKIQAYADTNGGQGQQPLLFPEAIVTDGATSILQRLDVRGVLPRAHDTLYAIWTTGGVYTSGNSATLAATAQPLFTTYASV